MGRELLLLRHGKSERRVDGDDLQRPLKDRGKRGAQRMGVWLLQHDLLPDHVISSPAQRAVTTAEKCCKSSGIAADHVRHDERLYLTPVDTLLGVLADCPGDARRVMLVGHNPGLTDLLRYFVDLPPAVLADGKAMPTAALARLALPDDWCRLQRGQGDLLDLVRQADLPEKFPYPAPHGSEWRDRPAYYYTQSAVIPYRVQQGRVEIMIIRSSSKRHWVVPKGIADPGHSLQASARQEAWEEAGIDGEVAEEALGSYSYPKWGSTCTVSVYAMAVSRVLSAQEWQERHRGRRWVSVGEAAALLKQADLRPMLMALEQRLSACQG